MSLFGGPLCCGFIKCATYEQQTSGYTLSTQHQNLKRLFSNIDVSEAVYKARGKKVKEDIIWLSKKDSNAKQEFVKTFSQQVWTSLSSTRQQKHGSFECKGCLREEKYRALLCQLRINKNDKIGFKNSEEKGLFRPVRRQIIEETEKDIKAPNDIYKENYSLSFESALQMSEKCSARQKRSEIAQEIKENIEDQWKETAVVR